MGVECLSLGCLSRMHAPDPSGYGDTLYKWVKEFHL